MIELQPGDWVDFEVSYLEMPSPPPEPPKPLPEGTQVIEITEAKTDTFMRFYEAVGAEYEWTDKLAQPREEVEAFIEHPERALFVLLDQQGAEAGFCLLDFAKPPIGDLAYFGLLPSAIGKGFGRAWLELAVAKLWADKRVQKITINTCTLDHPRALPLYKSVGFQFSRKLWATRQLTQPRTMLIQRSP
ncbi:MAG: GNAT family N-acetyltransferase [Pseudomonadota bacterium]